METNKKIEIKKIIFFLFIIVSIALCIIFLTLPLLRYMGNTKEQIEQPSEPISNSYLVITCEKGNNLTEEEERKITIYMEDTNGKRTEVSNDQCDIVVESDSKLDYNPSTGKIKVLAGFLEDQENFEKNFTITAFLKDDENIKGKVILTVAQNTYDITFSYPNPDSPTTDASKIITVIEGKSLQGKDYPKPNYGDNEYSWIIDKTDIEYNPEEDLYFWNQDVKVYATFKANTITFVDELFNSNISENVQICYGEKESSVQQKLSRIVPLKGMNNKNGWTFAGWFSNLNEEGENGIKEGIYCSKTATLYAKWTKNITLNPKIEGTKLVPTLETTAKEVIFNGNVTGIEDAKYTPSYNNGGLFAGWYIHDDTGQEIMLTPETKYMIVSNSEAYAKVKFPVEFDYQGATKVQDSTPIYVYYNGTVDNKLPMPTELNENGWKWIGWNTTSSCDGETFTETTIYREALPLKLYGERRGKITIYNALDSNGNPNEARTEIDLIYNNKLQFPTENPIAGEWTFGGYYTGYEDTDSKIVGTEVYKEEGNLNLYVRWTKYITLNPTIAEAELETTAKEVIFNGNVTGIEDKEYIPNYTNGGLFAGWYIHDDTGQEIMLTPETKYTIVSNSEAYAKVKFPVEFDYQGATPNQNSTPIYVYHNGTVDNKLPMPTELNENGWEWIGWYMTSSCEGEAFTETTPYREAQPLKLYGKRSGKFIINSALDSNGNPKETRTEIDLIYNNKLQFPTENPIAGEWTFGGYYTGYEDTDSKIVGTEVYKGEGNLNLYIRWKTEITFQIDYDEQVDPSLQDKWKISSTGSNKMKVFYKQKIKQLPGVDYGYDSVFSFQGWYTDKYGFGQELRSGEEYTQNCNQIFHSKTIAKAKFYDTLHDNKITELTVVYGQSMQSLSTSLPSLKEDLYWKHTGWNLKDEIDAGDILNGICYYNTPKEFYSVWEIPIYYNVNNEEIVDSISDNIGNLKYGQSLNLKKPNPQKFWKFEYWFVKTSDGIEKKLDSSMITSDSIFLELISSNWQFIQNRYCMQVYAKWTVVEKYTVTFNSNGGSAVDTIIDVQSGTTIEKPIDPTKAKYTFEGWYKDSGCTEAWNFESDTVTANITLYAKWDSIYLLL